ncbi:hypothetical protein, partial [Citrobacter freundii]
EYANITLDLAFYDER